MKIEKQKIKVSGIKFLVLDGEKEIGRAFLYFMNNDLHKRPFGYIEDVFVAESQRGKGVGTKLVQAMITEAEKKCYKIIMTSRYANTKVHKLYEKLGFKDWGKEFRK